MAAPAPTFHYSMMVIDIERSAERTNPEQIRNREALYGINHRALVSAGIEPLAREDRGDGFFQLFPASLAKQRLLGPFVAALDRELRAHSWDSGLRARLAMHAGEVARDAHGWGGADLNAVFRLADLPDLRAALAAAPRAVLAVAISDVLYQGVVRHNYPDTQPEAFRRIRYTVKEMRDQWAWIRVPGYVEPPGLDDGTVAQTTPAAEAGTAAQPGGAAEGPRVMNSGIGVMRDLRGGIGVVHGDVHQTPAGAPPAAGADLDLRRELTTLRELIIAALGRQEIDDEDCKDALRELDEAARHADAPEEEDRGRIARALRKLKGLLEHVAGIGDTISRILVALQGVS